MRQTNGIHLPYSKITPTRGFTRESTTYLKKEVILWDLSGDRDYRGIWGNYITKADIVILVIDASDLSEENKSHVESIYERYGKMFGKNTIVIFNKNDRKDFSIVPFIDILKKQDFFKDIIAVEEVNVLEPGLVEKLFRLVKRKF